MRAAAVGVPDPDSVDRPEADLRDRCRWHVAILQIRPVLRAREHPGRVPGQRRSRVRQSGGGKGEWILSGVKQVAAENIRDQTLNIPDNFLVGLFSVKLPLRFDVRNPARFANISDGPYPRAGGKGHAPQAFVIDSLIHTDRNISFIQARLSQLISIAGFSKTSYAVLLKELKRHSVVSQIPRFIKGRSSAT